MKKGYYYIRPTSQEARIELINYLEEHGFTYAHRSTRESTIESPFPVLIEVIPKTVTHIHQAAIAACTVKVLISEEEFYQKFEADPQNLIVWKKLYSEEQELVYEGYTYKNHPYGAGTAYFPDGTKYQEGVFDVKGLVYGREYYSNGKPRFEGAYEINRAYGPNMPIYGKHYKEDGELVYSGTFKLKYGGIGYPSVIVPEGYGSVALPERPSIHCLMWEEKQELEGE